ncbi:MAG: tripartite tricarboxylate transporter substrate binding protein [Burkholderiales bacterium]
MRIKSWFLLFSIACSTCLAVVVCAQNFPERPVTLIVPWSPGGGTDVAMRALAEATSKHLGQRVVVENRAGAAGTIGPAWMAKNGKSDGYVVSQMPITVFRLPHMTKTDFDPLNDFTWIIHLTGYTFGVVVRADSPLKTWQDLIAYARANPGKLSYGTPGTGTSLHITMEDIAAREAVTLLHVPFKGNADATAALLGGHIMASADSTGWGELVDAGKLRMLVTWGAQRTKRWPTVPTLKEACYNIVSVSPYGIAGPKGMDAKVVRVLHDAFKKGMEEPAFQKVLERLDQQENFYMNSEDYARYAKKTYDEERLYVERMGLKQ